MPRMRLSHLNSLEILQLVRVHGYISRSQVAEKAGASPFLVSKKRSVPIAARSTRSPPTVRRAPFTSPV